jgi:predicted RNA binding protein YcfA (HicA-like mRNA interferase family)
MASEPPWFGDDVVHLQGALVLVGAAALAAAPGASVNPVVHRAADGAAVAAAVGKHLFAALLAEGIKALAAELQHRVALAIAQPVAADQGVGAVAIAGDAVAGEHLAHHPFHAFVVVVDLGHVLPQDPTGHVVRGGGEMGASWLGRDGGWHLETRRASPSDGCPTPIGTPSRGTYDATSEGRPDRAYLLRRDRTLQRDRSACGPCAWLPRRPQPGGDARRAAGQSPGGDRHAAGGRRAEPGERFRRPAADRCSGLNVGSTPVLKPSEVVGILRKLGFELGRQRGSHLQFRDARGRGTTVPAHQGRDIAPPLLRQIAKDIGMSLEEFLGYR